MSRLGISAVIKMIGTPYEVFSLYRSRVVSVCVWGGLFLKGSDLIF